MPFDQCWVQKFSASNLFLLAPRVANSAWAGSACMSKTDAQSGPVVLSKLKCCKNSNLDGKTMENLPFCQGWGVPHWKCSLSHQVFVAAVSFFLDIKHHYPQNHSQKVWAKEASSKFSWASVNFLAFLRHKKPGYFFSASPRMPIQTGRSFSPLSTQRECHGENFQRQDPETWAMLKQRVPGCLRDLFGGITDYTQLWGEYNKSPINHYIRIPFKTT